MRTAFIAPLLLSLLACSGTGGTRQQIASYDLPSEARATAPTPSVTPPILRQIDFHAPSWLDTSAMQYRLSYVDKARRSSYAGSRWVAPPARLLEQRLKQRLLSDASGAAAGCRLRAELDEFVQEFDRPEVSRAIIEARLSLLPARGESVVARRHFLVAQVAGVNASDGVGAFNIAAGKFADEIETWLRQIGGPTSQLCRPG